LVHTHTQGVKDRVDPLIAPWSWSKGVDASEGTQRPYGSYRKSIATLSRQQPPQERSCWRR